MELLERFLSYVAYDTTSDEASDATPSTAGQRALAEHIAAELSGLGLRGVRVDEYSYVYAMLPKSCEGMATVGLLAHLDTSSDMPGGGIRPRLLCYEGGDIPQGEGRAIPAEGLEYYLGHRLIVTDGRTLLGADDKAGIAEIVTAVETLIREGHPHGTVCLCFTPDEEIGRGVDHFDPASFPVDYAYTVDGGRLGELEYENFNAAGATLSFRGLAMHPGSAKGRMRNAVRIAAEFDSLLPGGELPELTEGYEGFHHLVSLRGTVTEAESTYLIRDHDAAAFAEKKATFARLAAQMKARYGEGTVTLTLRDSYYNMKEAIDKAPYTVERARAAMQALGITPIERPIRGGTDGALLSHRGLPCPNLGTGAFHMHSGRELASLDDMQRTVELLVRLLSDATALG